MRFCIKKQKSKIKQEKGITLIALAVTIVIIIILAGITINGVFGDNGVLKQAKGTQDKTESLIEKEEEKINYLEEEYMNVINENKVFSTVSITVDEMTENSITIFVNVTGNIGTEILYKYYIDGEEKNTSNINMYTFNDLELDTNYTIKVEAYDEFNNKIEAEKTISTTKYMYPKIEEKLKVGDYVYYVDAKGITRKCVVLYDNTFNYGLQIITMDTVEDVEIGSNNITIAINSYNDVISTLNSKAALYNNEKYSTGARSVGTVPNNPNKDDAGYFTSSNSYMQSYNGKLKNSDTNYETDYNQMTSLSIQNISKSYWLASRLAEDGNIFSSTTFNIYSINKSGTLDNSNSTICSFGYWTGTRCSSYSYGLRPVFTLKNGIRISGGSGTPSSPYTLGILY